MASFSDAAGKTVFHDWAEAETRPLDLVASWESLCATYELLGFSDPISDTTRMEEFKWIIKEMNKHLTRAKKQLMSCRDAEAMQQVLKKMFSPAGGTTVTNRSDLAYHKLRQQWVNQMLMQLNAITERQEEEEDGEPEH